MRIVAIERPPDADKEAVQRQLQRVENAINANQPVRWGKRYTRFYSILFEAFHGKCGYCESPVPTLSKLRIDHFRPKGPVVNENRQVVTSKGQAHPGYHWLAYEWGNLIPACEACNNAKGAQFPIQGRRAFGIADSLSKEHPLLICPVKNPRQSVVVEKELRFLMDGGVQGLSERGKRTVEVCRLDRSTLRSERLSQVEAFTALAGMAITCAAYGKRTAALKAKLAAAGSGRVPYSAAASAAVRRVKGRVCRLLGLPTLGL